MCVSAESYIRQIPLMYTISMVSAEYTELTQHTAEATSLVPHERVWCTVNVRASLAPELVWCPSLALWGALFALWPDLWCAMIAQQFLFDAQFFFDVDFRRVGRLTNFPGFSVGFYTYKYYQLKIRKRFHDVLIIRCQWRILLVVKVI